MNITLACFLLGFLIGYCICYSIFRTIIWLDDQQTEELLIDRIKYLEEKVLK